MIDFGTAGQAQLASRVRGAQWLVDLEFTGGTIRLTTNPLDIAYGGNTYKGLSTLLQVSSVSESEDAAAEKVTLSIPVVNQAMLAATLGNVESYRGRRVRLYLQLIDESFQPITGAVRERWRGYMEPVRITRKRSDPTGGESSGRIELPCSRAGMARARNYTGLRLTDAQHRQRYPGDRGLEYMQELIEKPTQWLSKRFQEI